MQFVGGHFQQCSVDVDRGCIPSFGACAGWDSGNLLGERPRDVCKPRDAGAPAEEKFGTRLQIGRTSAFGQKECIYAQGRKVPIIKYDFVWSM